MLTCLYTKVVFVTLFLWNVVFLVGLWTNIRNPSQLCLHSCFVKAAPLARGHSTATASEASKLRSVIQRWSSLDELQWQKDVNSLRGQMDDQKNILWFLVQSICWTYIVLPLWFRNLVPHLNPQLMCLLLAEFSLKHSKSDRLSRGLGEMLYSVCAASFT